MQVKKKVISSLTKCYSIAPLHYHNRDYFLVAAEKQDPCYLFDMEGNRVDTIWEKPGGVMSMVQIPGSDGVFLATHKFYSPNDSKEARIVVVKPDQDGKWQIHTLACLPHVHRFDIVTRNDVHYLVACTLKSGHEYKNDWSMPGKVYAAVPPEDLDQFDEQNQLKFTVIKDGMLKNHGYYKVMENGVETSLISSEEGVFRFTPPEEAGGAWYIEHLVKEPASDAVLVDLDQDGEKELICISPFHGNKICIYKKHRMETEACSCEGDSGEYEPVYCYEKADFAHAIYGGRLLGRPAVIIGHREGTRDLLVFTYDGSAKDYRAEVLDHDCGPANVYKFVENGKEILISANREVNEVAMYTDFAEDLT